MVLGACPYMVMMRRFRREMKSRSDDVDLKRAETLCAVVLLPLFSVLCQTHIWSQQFIPDSAAYAPRPVEAS